MSRGEALAMAAGLPADAPPASQAAAARLRALITENFALVWRSLVRLGVPRADAEDALQQVFLVASRRLGDIEEGRERAFLFSTALRIAARARRTQQRRREVFDEHPTERLDPAPGPEEIISRARARAELSAILDAMPLDLRAVFVLFELEQSTMAEIAALLAIPPGTVASRLRRAREHFQSAVRRLAERRPPRGER
jgi:RNA polymerase sigma-70 factor, ECF subfamily